MNDETETRVMWSIEDFLLPGEVSGPDFDWYPVIVRAQDRFVERAKENKQFRVHCEPIHFGLSQSAYKIFAPSTGLDLFGFWLKSLRQDLELKFVSGNGLVLHYPNDGTTSGTHASGYGGASIFEGPVRLSGSGLPETVGLHAHIDFIGRGVVCDFWGSHGFCIDADAHHGRGNASRWLMDRCVAIACGFNTKTLGCGLMIQGGDTNIGISRQFSALNNSGWAIWDSSFLGNRHESPHARGNGHVVQAGEDWSSLVVGGKPVATVGQTLPLAYCASGASARSVFESPYVEGPAIVDLRAPSFAVAGIGGQDTDRTHRFGNGLLEGAWALGNMLIGNGVIYGFGDPADHAGWPYRLHYANNFYRLDYRSLNAAVAELMTGSTSRAPDGRILMPGRKVELDHYVGPGMVPVSWAAAPPTTGAFPIGAQVWNTAPAPGRPAFWVVTGHNDAGEPIWSSINAT